MRKLVLLLLAFGQIIYAFTQSNYGITVFGTDQFSVQEIRDDYNLDLNELLELYESDREQYRQKQVTLSKELQQLGAFAYANVNLFRSYQGKIDFIIDFVEKKDSSKRLNFKQIEGRRLKDPNDLISQWQAYEEASNALFQKGEITDMECPIIHCTWSFNHPHLTPYLAHFEKHAQANKEKLIETLMHSNIAEDRGAAAFLLAHSVLDEAELLAILIPSINDPESIVRNNSMRVIYYIARAQPALITDVAPFIEALDYPSFTDRNKALVILRSLNLDKLSPNSLKRLLPILLEVLEKKDAHNHRNAYRILKNISQENFAIDDLDNWNEWAAKLMKE